MQNMSQQGHVTLKKPQIVGYMSVDVYREFNADLSQLKFLNNISNEDLYMNLNHRINEAIKRTTNDNNEKIILLLKFILNNKQYLLNIFEHLTIVTYRRTLISVMCNAVNQEHTRIIASLFNGSIYLCSVESPKHHGQSSNNTQNEIFCAWGYKFEQYMLSDLPDKKPDIEKPVVENEEFTLYYQSELGQHKLLYGAQIDGLLATSGRVQLPPETNDYRTNLDYLRNNEYIELKTNREIQHRRQELSFRRYKMLRCWCQCYLAALKGLLVGFRNDDGIVSRLQYYNTNEIVNYCQGEWHPHETIQFLDYFLSYVKNAFKQFKKPFAGDAECVSLIFDLNGTNISFSKCDKNDVILPAWYTEAIKKKD